MGFDNTDCRKAMPRNGPTLLQTDVITDFRAGAATEDAVNIDHALFADFNPVMAHAACGAGRSNVVITFDQADTITLSSVTMSILHSDDFLFF